MNKEQVEILNIMAGEYFLRNAVKLDTNTDWAELDDAIYTLWDSANSTRATEKGRAVGGTF